MYMKLYNICGSFLVFIIVVPHFAGPKSEIIPDELHDGGGVFIAIFLDGLDVCDGIIEGSLGNLAGHGLVAHDLIIEDGEIQGETKSNRVGGFELLVGDGGGAFVGFHGEELGILVLVVLGVLADVTMVVSLHFHEKHFGFIGVGRGDQIVVQKVDDVVAVGVQLDLDLLLVFLQQAQFVAVLCLLLLFDGRQSSPSSSSTSHGVLVSH